MTQLRLPKPLLMLALGLCIVASAARPALAQDDAAGEEATPKKKKEKVWSILPIPAVATLPETGLLFGPVMAITYNPPKDTITRLSTASVYAIWTVRGQFYTILRPNIWTKNNNYNITMDGSYYRFPENYWGVGNNTPDSNEENYDSRRVEILTSVGRKVRDNFYVGPSYYLNTIDRVEPLPGGLLEQGTVTGSAGGTASGLGYILRYDTRQNPLNAKDALYVDVSQHFFNPSLGSDFTFSRLQIDSRWFIPVKPIANWTTHTLALGAYGVFTTGDPPFRMMGILGGRPLRGYYWGRFRDRQYMAFQAEYRAPIWWRLGATVYAGVGQVAPTLGAFSASGWKPGFGVGLRVRALGDINIRLDMAWGEGTNSGLYIDMGENH